MNRGVIKAYILKEISELLRSRVIIMVYLIPSMIMFLFGNGIKMEVKNADTVILDHDRSKLSLHIISKFEHSKYFSTKVLDISEREALDMMKQGKIGILIIIPEGFEKKVLKGQKVDIAVFVDSAFPMRGMTMESYVEGVLYQVMEEGLGRSAGLVKINHRNLFNQAMRDEDAIVPGLFGIILLVSPAILSALLIVKEKETGTIFNFYSSPVRKIDFLVAKLTPVFFLHSINIFILFLWATYVFDVPFRGNFAIFWLVSEIYIVISLSIGLLVSIVTRTQIVALLAVIIITLIPGFLYSGIMMPISSMKGEAYIEAHLFPVMYYNHIIYDTFLIGQGFSSPKNVLYMIILIFYGLFLLILGSLLMKKEMK
ncbi:ABC transporter permease [Persephonella sp.]